MFTSSDEAEQDFPDSWAEDPGVADELFPLLYDELRRLAARALAREGPNPTLRPTELVHEAYLRLSGNRTLRWRSKAHFYAVAARAMRRMLVDRARRRLRLKHGGGMDRVPLEIDELAIVEPPPDRLLALDEALDRLARTDERQAKIVALRYFAGLTIEETAEALEISPTTVTDEWKFARAWLYRELSRGDGSRG